MDVKALRERQRTGTPMESTNSRTTCVVLTSSEQLDVAINSAFVERGWRAHLANDPLLAMADLCLLDKAQTSRSAWGLPRAEPLRLLIVEPQQWRDVASMVAAVRTHLPATDVWEARNGALTRVVEAQVAPAAAPAPAPPQLTTSRPARSPSDGPGEAPVEPPMHRDPAPLRLTEASAPGSGPASEDESDSPQITPEELAMLLDTEKRDSST